MWAARNPKSVVCSFDHELRVASFSTSGPSNDGGKPSEGCVIEEQAMEISQPGPEDRLGAALRRAREGRGVSLRALAKRLCRSHSSLVEYERGHRLAPL